VPQDPFLFDFSVRDNLLWAKPGHSDAELWRSLEMAGGRMASCGPWTKGLTAGSANAARRFQAASASASAWPGRSYADPE